MKKIKKFLLTIAMTMIFSISAFAASGFEFILNVPFGLSVGFESVDLGMLPGADGITQRKIEDASPGVGFDIGVTAQLGYMFQVKDGFGISVLGELGYSHDTISGTYSKIEGGDGNSINWSGIKAIYTLEQFQIGLLPKFNIGAFSIGIGGGVKIPISAKERVKIDSLGIDEKSKFKPADAVQGYIKLTFDYSIFFGSKMALNIGAYLGYDFGLAQKNAIDNEYNSVDSFDLGLQLGLRFAPKL